MSNSPLPSVIPQEKHTFTKLKMRMCLSLQRTVSNAIEYNQQIVELEVVSV